MPDGQVLEFSGVTKRFGGVTAVDRFTARVEPGQVTGFLGPNGAGKTTTLRILLGLVRASDGTATIGGVSYAKLRDPLRTVGAVLEASSFHPGRTGANHLKVYAHAAGLPDSRVDDVLGTVGLADVGGRKVGGYSLGMRQRLGLAYALLGDPGVLVLDEPTNGLDPEGIKWMRGLLRELARQGRTVLVSSHLLAEVQQTVDSLVIISRGRLVFQGSLGDLTDPSEYTTVTDSGDRAALASALRAADIETEVLRSGLVVRGVDPASVGAAAAAGGVALTLLQRRGPALEEIFLDLVNGTRVHASASGAPAAEAPDAVAAPVIDEAAAIEEAPVIDEAPAEEAEAPAAVEALVADEALAVDEAPVADEALAADDAEPAADLEFAGGESDAPDAEPIDRAEPEHTEPEQIVAVESEGDADAAEPEAVTNAGFVVAGTGIIDVVPSTPETGQAEPGAESSGEHIGHDAAAHGVFSVGSTGETTETDSIDIAQDDAPHDRHGDTPGDTPEDESGDDGASEASDRSWENYVKTDSDHEADRFFAGFTAESEPGFEAASDDRDADDREGGEHR